MTDFPKIVLITFTMIGIMTKTLLSMVSSSNDGSYGSASTTIWGNLIMIFSIISYLSIHSDYLYPLTLFIMVLMWDTTISYKYFERINKKEIPRIYYSWSFFSNLMMLSFIILLIYNIFADNDAQKGQITNILYIIGFFSLTIVGVQQTILDNFMVDKDYLDINL